MRVLLTAISLLTANGAMASGEGRYVTTVITDGMWILTDTKTGRFRLCDANLGSMERLWCHPWFDGVDGVAQPLAFGEREPAWKFVEK
jgi:hypothetical protein